jgi:lipopolysaccharide transport system ATP-binding protein
MSSDLAIKVKNLSKCYQIYGNPSDRLKQFLLPGLRQLIGLPRKQYYREFWALKDVSFEVHKGETIGILGRNGSGKSTLLQIICQTLGPTKGFVTTQGRIAALLELGSGFNPEFTGRENVYMNASILGLSKDEIDARFDEISTFADIGDHLNQPVKTYSSGMAVRLAFAVQACVLPQVLIVDEALAVGDEKFQRKCYDYIEKLRKGGCSILLVTHSTATIEKFCQRAILLHNGKLHGIGPANEIVDQYHALLYSDENAYLRYQAARVLPDSKALPLENRDLQSLITDSPNQHQASISSDIHAVITSWIVLDFGGNRTEQFRTGEDLSIRFFVDVLNPVEEIQAGILLRTVEGVSAFGTSTLYHQANYKDARPGSRLMFEFQLKANLCAGSYFVTLAIAKTLPHGDMLYLDRKTDVIVIKIYQPSTLATGIAMLETTVASSEVFIDI